MLPKSSCTSLYRQTNGMEEREVERAFFRSVAEAQELSSVVTEERAGTSVLLDTSVLQDVDVDGLLRKLSVDGTDEKPDTTEQVKAEGEGFVVKVAASNAKVSQKPTASAHGYIPRR